MLCKEPCGRRPERRRFRSRRMHDGRTGEVIVTSTGVDLHALIVDQNLAGVMKGTELAAYARSKHPHLNIVVMSGNRLGSLPRDTVFLQKPFQAEHLLEAVRD